MYDVSYINNFKVYFNKLLYSGAIFIQIIVLTNSFQNALFKEDAKNAH